MRAVTALCLGLLLASGTASAGDKIRIVNEGGIAAAWTLAPGASLPVPAYPEAYAQDQKEVCVAIGYLLNPDGTTSNFALLKSWTQDEPKRDAAEFWQAFANDASNALARWKFAPRPEVTDPKPVYTVATFLFAAKNPAELRAHCAISDLAYRIVELKQDKKAARRMANDEFFSRLDIDPLLEQRYRRQQYEISQMLRNAAEPKPKPPSQQQQGH